MIDCVEIVEGEVVTVPGGAWAYLDKKMMWRYERCVIIEIGDGKCIGIANIPKSVEPVLATAC